MQEQIFVFYIEGKNESNTSEVIYIFLYIESLYKRSTLSNLHRLIFPLSSLLLPPPFCSVHLQPGHKESNLAHARKPWREGIKFCRGGSFAAKKLTFAVKRN